MGAMLTAFGLIFLAELGDKSMFFSLAAATRFPWWMVLVPVSIATALLMAMAVVAGGLAGELLPDRLVALVAAALFVGFGVWSLLAGEEDDEDDDAPSRAGGSALRVMAALGAVFFLTEFGDKTQIATMSLAGLESGNAAWVWVGATGGMLATNGLAIAAGARLSGWLASRPEARRWVQVAAGVVFIGFGLLAAVLAFI